MVINKLGYLVYSVVPAYSQILLLLLLAAHPDVEVPNDPGDEDSWGSSACSKMLS